MTDSGAYPTPEFFVRMLAPPRAGLGAASDPPAGLSNLIADYERRIDRLVDERNGKFLDAESTKLDHWADDLKLGLEVELKDIDRQIRDAKQSGRSALTLDEKLVGQREVKRLEQLRRDKRRALYQEQDRIDQERDALITRMEGQLVQRATSDTLFTVRWTVKG